jgi:tRNA-binding protein
MRVVTFKLVLAKSSFGCNFLSKKTMDNISWTDFEKVEMRVGTILNAQLFDKAKKPAYQLEINFGSLGILKSSAQITSLYQPETLIGRQIIAVVNFPPKQIANFFSECLVLGVYNENNEVVLLQTTQPVANGCKVG